MNDRNGMLASGRRLNILVMLAEEAGLGRNRTGALKAKRAARLAIAKPPRCIYKPRVVARTGEDLHDYVLFALRLLASEAHAGCPRRPLGAFSVSIDRARPRSSTSQ
jgi:hypothetical protein